mgnify:FL=1
MSVAWFFGDSFCAANEVGDVPQKGIEPHAIPDYWWGVDFANSLGKEINIQSQGGSSIEYTMLQIEEQTENIQRDDTVVVCYTNPYRLYFNGHNITPTSINIYGDKNEPNDIGFNGSKISPEVIDTAKRFMLHVFNKEKQERLWISHVLYIQNNLIPYIKSKGARVIEFYSFNTLKYLNVDIAVNLADKLKQLPVAETFIIQNASRKGVRPEPILQSPNHFGTNDTEINLNKQWADYLLTLLPKNT